MFPNNRGSFEGIGRSACCGLLGLAFAIFPTYIKRHIKKWLFLHGDPDERKGETEKE